MENKNYIKGLRRSYALEIVEKGMGGINDYDVGIFSKDDRICVVLYSKVSGEPVMKTTIFDFEVVCESEILPYNIELMRIKLEEGMTNRYGEEYKKDLDEYISKKLKEEEQRENKSSETKEQIENASQPNNG